MPHPSTQDGIGHRVDRQLDRVRDCMLIKSPHGKIMWWTIDEIHTRLKADGYHAQHTSISARIRELPTRCKLPYKRQLCKRLGPTNKLWEYRINEPETAGE